MRVSKRQQRVVNRYNADFLKSDDYDPEYSFKEGDVHVIKIYNDKEAFLIDPELTEYFTEVIHHYDVASISSAHTIYCHKDATVRLSDFVRSSELVEIRNDLTDFINYRNQLIQQYGSGSVE